MWRWGPGRLPVLRIDRRWVIAFAAVAVPAVLWVRLSAPPTPDVSWLLYAAGVLKDGGTYGLDVIDITPPTIFWPKIAALVVGDAFGLSAWAAWVGGITLLAAASTALTWRLARGLAHGAALAPLAALVFLLLPGRDFGQREHLALICVVPWLVSLARRLEGRPAKGLPLTLAMLLAACGLAIKPHFALVWWSAAALLVYRWRSLRVLAWPELLGVAALGGLQVLAVLLFFPAYLEHLRVYGSMYVGFLAAPLWQVMLLGIGPAAVLLALLARAALRASRDSRAEGSTALLAGAVGFWFAIALQHKGWAYHYLPLTGLSVISLGVLLDEETGRLSGLTARLYRAAAVGGLTMALLTPALHAALEVTRLEPVDRRGLDPDLEALLPLVRAASAHGPVFVFSTNIASDFPLVTEAGARWAFRQPSLQLLGAAYADQIGGSGMVKSRSLEDRLPGERQLTADLAADLRRAPPALILVLQPDPTAPGWGGAKRHDYLAYFRADPAMGRILDGYVDGGRVGNYAFLVRDGLSLAAPTDEPAGVAAERGRASLLFGPLQAGADVVALLCFGAGFALGWKRRTSPPG